MDEKTIFNMYCDNRKINELYRWFLFKTIRANPDYKIFKFNRVTEHYMAEMFKIKTWMNN